MFCVYNHKSDCDACGRCIDKNEENIIWDFDTAEGREEFLEDLWSFIFSMVKPPEEKTKVISSFLQGFLEDMEQEFIDSAIKYFS